MFCISETNHHWFGYCKDSCGLHDVSKGLSYALKAEIVYCHERFIAHSIKFNVNLGITPQLGIKLNCTLEHPKRREGCPKAPIQKSALVRAVRCKCGISVVV